MLIPNARVLNLFSRDIYVIDQVLPMVCIESDGCARAKIVYNILQAIMHFTRTIATTAFILVVISLSFPLFLVAIMPLTWFYLRVTV